MLTRISFLAIVLGSSSLKKCISSEIVSVEYEDDIQTIVVRTKKKSDYQKKLKKKILTSGCAQGTVFGDVMEKFDKIKLSETAIIKTSWLYKVTKSINICAPGFIKYLLYNLS